ncbi:Serine/threonine-protein kinase CTR1 [Camellia lanceoleosa]|nr:Serine/threonine-protein kinase CTR1 [Camellia lanceoleosa]
MKCRDQFHELVKEEIEKKDSSTKEWKIAMERSFNHMDNEAIKLADYIGLPCRIAQGCKYCVADHRSSCLVQIEDDGKLPREYVVDLVREPGNVHGPDSSINRVRLSSLSPFRISHLKEFQQPYIDNDHIVDPKLKAHMCPFKILYILPRASGGAEEQMGRNGGAQRKLIQTPSTWRDTSIEATLLKKACGSHYYYYN